jgi:hypothetical protein
MKEYGLKMNEGKVNDGNFKESRHRCEKRETDMTNSEQEDQWRELTYTCRPKCHQIIKEMLWYRINPESLQKDNSL